MVTPCRVYDRDKIPEKGYVILVDRLWPRGIKKSDLKTDEWLKDLAPSTGLRKWFGHDPDKWKEFKKEYRKELKKKGELMQRIKDLEKKHKRIILLYASKNIEHNHAVVLKKALDELE